MEGVTQKVNAVKWNKDHTVKGKELVAGTVQQDAVGRVHPLIPLNLN